MAINICSVILSGLWMFRWYRKDHILFTNCTGGITYKYLQHFTHVFPYTLAPACERQIGEVLWFPRSSGKYRSNEISKDHMEIDYQEGSRINRRIFAEGLLVESMKTLNLERETCLVVFHFFFALIVNLVKKFECARGVTNFMAPSWGIGPQAVSWGSRSRFVVELQISIQLTPWPCVFLDSNQQQKV